MLKYLSRFLHHLLDKPIMIVVYLLLIDVGIFVYSYNFAYDFCVQWGVKHIWAFIIFGIIGFLWSGISNSDDGTHYYYEEENIYEDKGSQSKSEAERRIHKEGYAPDMSNGYDREVVADDEKKRR